MNSTEKRRAEQFVIDWNNSHPIKIEPVQVPPSKELQSALKTLQRQWAAINTMAKAEYRSILLIRQNYTTYSDLEPEGIQISSPNDEHPAVKIAREAVATRTAARNDAIQNLIRRTWNDEVTFQNVLDELDALAK